MINAMVLMHMNLGMGMHITMGVIRMGMARMVKRATMVMLMKETGTSANMSIVKCKVAWRSGGCMIPSILVILILMALRDFIILQVPR